MSSPVRLDPFQRIVNVGWGAKIADHVVFRFRNPRIGMTDADQRQNIIRSWFNPVSQEIEEEGERVGWYQDSFGNSDPADPGFSYRPGTDRLRMYGQTGLANYREDIFLADLGLIRTQTHSDRIAVYSANLNGRDHPFSGEITLVAQAYQGSALAETEDDDRITGTGTLVETSSMNATVDGRSFGSTAGQLLGYFLLNSLQFVEPE